MKLVAMLVLLGVAYAELSQRHKSHGHRQARDVAAVSSDKARSIETIGARIARALSADAGMLKLGAVREKKDIGMAAPALGLAKFGAAMRVKRNPGSSVSSCISAKT